MTLTVPFAQFTDAVRRELAVKSVYIHAKGAWVVVTAANVNTGASVQSTTRLPADKIRETLKKDGFLVNDGSWATIVETELPETHSPLLTVVAIGYSSADNVPGVWVDAFPEEPAKVDALRAMFDEFRQSGELDDVPFEEFLRLSNPNVTIVSGAELAKYLASKRLPA